MNKSERFAFDSCGCGREGRYMVSTLDGPKLACNKYARCATREELLDTAVYLRLASIELASSLRDMIAIADTEENNQVEVSFAKHILAKYKNDTTIS